MRRQKMLAVKSDHVRRMDKLKELISKGLVVTITLGSATLVSVIFRSLGINEMNIIMTYILAVLIVSYRVEGYWAGYFASLASVLLFMYFFAEPYYKFQVNSPEYPLTLVFMLAVSWIGSTMTTNIRREASKSELRDKRSTMLFALSQKLSASIKNDETDQKIGLVLSEALENTVVIADVSESNEIVLVRTYVNGQEESSMRVPDYHISLMREMITKPSFKITGKQFYDDQTMIYLPVIGKMGTLKIVGFSLGQEKVDDDSVEMYRTIVTMLGMTYDREYLYKEFQEAAIMVKGEQLRSNMLRSISHDLRTPLTSMLATVGFLADNYNSIQEGERQELISSMYEETEWLIHTVENILSITQLESGNVKMIKKPEYVEEVIEETLKRLERQLKYRNVSIDISSEAECIEMDARMIQQVLLNLLDNACKFTPPGAQITIKAIAIGDFAQISVIDTGLGIPRSAMGNLFKRFYTTGEATDRRMKGIGLGLEICKTIVEAHGGRIEAYNNRGSGATFEFTLPLKG